MPNRILALCAASVSLLALQSNVVFAEAAITVECQSVCSTIQLGAVCDTWLTGRKPSAIACDDTSGGSGVSRSCGSNGAVCKLIDFLSRSQNVGNYCDDGSGRDVVVTCQ